jgi:BirA family biotin operon repressor/biotin-[acetyl-CoA-carboxylase] ligase
MSGRAGQAAFGRELPAGFSLVALEAVGSTNDEARQLGRGGASGGTVVWAKRQEAGRGRQGRSWHSPEGNLYCSVLLRPPCRLSEAAQLSFVAALALEEALAAALPGGIERKLKWPNDVLVEGRKVAGILLEAETGAAGELAFVVLGMGINVAHHPADSDRPTSSLRAFGSACEAHALLFLLLNAFARWQERWLREGFSCIRSNWLARSYEPGAPVTVRLIGEKLEGAFAGLDAAGTLLIDVGGPAPRRVSAGDVFFGSAGP